MSKLIIQGGKIGSSGRKKEIYNIRNRFMGNTSLFYNL